VGREWVPIPRSFTVQTPRLAHLEDMTVSALIDTNDRQWNRHLISLLFLPEDVAAILSMPLSPLLPLDRLLWRCTKNGVFTVRSAYHLGI
jgi:hypothetical protein